MSTIKENNSQNSNNKIKYLLKNLIKEQVKSTYLLFFETNEERKEGSSDAIYGMKLFAPNRCDLAAEDKEEMSTQEERDLFTAMESWYAGNQDGDNLLKQQLDNIKNVIDNGFYTEILGAPPNANVYRLIQDVDVQSAAKILGISTDKLTSRPGKAVSLKKDGTISSESGIQPWIQGFKAFFSQIPEESRSNSGLVSIAIKTNTKKRNGFFFLNPKGIKTVSGFPRQAYENNTLASYGPIRYDAAAFVYNGHFTKKTIQSLKRYGF